jgi:hypothetical protein
VSTADLIAAAPVSSVAPAWREGALSLRVDFGTGALADMAAELDGHAADRGFTVGEVARVERGDVSILYARAAKTTAPEPAPSPSAALLKAREFVGFLDKAITDTKSQAMNKFAELAAKSAALRKSLDDRADSLMKRMDAIPTLADAAFAKHETALDEAEGGIKAMEDALRDLAGHNGAPN